MFAGAHATSPAWPATNRRDRGMAWTGRYDQLFIGGEWVTSTGGAVIDVVSPMTEEVIASVPSASLKDAELAIAAARRAYDSGPWPRMSLDERLDVLRRFRDLYAEHEDTMAQLVTDEMGCP